MVHHSKSMTICPTGSASWKVTPSLSFWKPLLSRRTVSMIQDTTCLCTWAPWWSSSEGYVDMATNIPSQHSSNKLKHTTPSTPSKVCLASRHLLLLPCRLLHDHDPLKSVSIGWDTPKSTTIYWIHLNSWFPSRIALPTHPQFLPVLLHFSPCGTLLQRSAQVTQATFTDSRFSPSVVEGLGAMDSKLPHILRRGRIPSKKMAPASKHRGVSLKSTPEV